MTETADDCRRVVFQPRKIERSGLFDAGWGLKEADAIIASDGCWHNLRPERDVES